MIINDYIDWIIISVIVAGSIFGIIYIIVAIISLKIKIWYREKIWISKYEPVFRKSKNYPDDWHIRRLKVFYRVMGYCENCGTETGVISSNTSRNVVPINNLNDEKWDFTTARLHAAEVHHKIPVRNGGDHSLDNLQLLCRSCHLSKHPNNRSIEIRYLKDRLRTTYVPRSGKIVVARNDKRCAVCKSIINKGDKYYYAREIKVCMSCIELI